MSTKFKTHVQLVFTILLLFTSNLIIAQCSGSTGCQVCGVTATISNVQGATVNNGASTITGSVNAGNQGIGSPFELTATGCGTISFDVALDFEWDGGTGNNWIHGISYNSSPGWAVAQGNVPGPGWLYQNSLVGCCSGAAYGAGYYYDGTANSSNCCNGTVTGNPADNYGLDCTSDCAGSYVFSLEYCPNGNGSLLETVTFTLTDDGETGAWEQPAGCVFDIVFPVQINDTGFDLPFESLGPVCPGDAVQLNPTPAACAEVGYQWDNGLGSNPSPVVSPTMTTTYCVEASTVNGCAASSCVDVLVEACCEAMAGTVAVSNTCESEVIPASVTGNNTDASYGQFLVLTDVLGNILESLSGNAGVFNSQVTGDYLVYSYNADGVNGCGLPFPPFNSNMNDLDCSTDPACGELSFVPFSVLDGCTASIDMNMPATLINPPSNITLICGDPLPPLLPLTYDNGLTSGCQDTGTINGTITDNSNGCTGLVQYNWTGTDACGNVLSHTQNIIYIIPCAPNHNLSGTESGIYDYETNGIITSTQIIDAMARVDYDSAIEINMNAGFEVVLGAEFNAFIDGCNSGGGGVNIQSESDNQ